MVASGHAPCSDELRADGDFVQAWAGVSGLQFIMQATWTEARLRGHSVGELARWLSAAPAALLGLTGRKGELREGADADFVVWDPNELIHAPHADYHRLRGSPYANMSLHGFIEQTVVAGVPAFLHGAHTDTHCGAVLLTRRAHTASVSWGE
mmetsp:Transcript_22998/g.58403  ORF Transcript_22998/g.58403 Transcript_22998/m.58403 type:complete len:152 (+) Transcript_22998:596-1051(+)